MILREENAPFKIGFEMGVMKIYNFYTGEVIQTISDISIDEVKLNKVQRTMFRSDVRGVDVTEDDKLKTTNAMKRVIQGKSQKVRVFTNHRKKKNNTLYPLIDFLYDNGVLSVHVLDFHNKERVSYITYKYTMYEVQDGFVRFNTNVENTDDVFLREFVYTFFYVDEIVKEIKTVQREGVKEDATVQAYLESYKKQTGTQILFGLRLSRQRKLNVLKRIFEGYNVADHLIGFSKTKLPPLKQIVVAGKVASRQGFYSRQDDLIELTIGVAEGDEYDFYSLIIHEYMHKIQADFLNPNNRHYETNKALYDSLLNNLKQTGKAGLMESVCVIKQRFPNNPRFVARFMHHEEILCRAMETYYFKRYLGLTGVELEKQIEKHRLLTDRELDMVLNMLAKVKYSFE